MNTQQTTRDRLNAAVKALAARDRPAAVAILAKFGALVTPEVKNEDVPAALAAVEALNASAPQ